MKKKVVGKSGERSSKKDIKEEKQELKKTEIKKQENKQDFFSGSGSVLKEMESPEEELEEIIEQVSHRRRFMPVLTSSVQELEDSFDESEQINLEKSLKNVSSSKNQSNLNLNYALSKDLQYGINKYESKPSYNSSVGITSSSPIQEVQNPINFQGDSVWKDVSNKNPEPGVDAGIVRNKNYEPKRKNDNW